jgi:hypothetical protein
MEQNKFFKLEVFEKRINNKESSVQKAFFKYNSKFRKLTTILIHNRFFIPDLRTSESFVFGCFKKFIKTSESSENHSF